MLKWIKHYNNRPPILGMDDVSWSNTQLNNIIAVTVRGHTLTLGLGDYHYEEDWEVTVGEDDHRFICARIMFDGIKAMEVYASGSVSRYI